jgi:hypothetical protein
MDYSTIDQETVIKAQSEQSIDLKIPLKWSNSTETGMASELQEAFRWYVVTAVMNIYRGDLYEVIREDASFWY